MYCIVGLGNPGKQYSQTRHNAGFLVLDKLVQQTGSKLKRGFQSGYSQTSYEGQRLLLVQPQTYMNLSGAAVGEIINYFKIPLDRLLVVYDEMDLPLGALRFRPGGSAGGHKGLASIISALNTDRFSRLRVGVGRPPAGVAVYDYVLSSYRGAEALQFEAAVAKGAEATLAFIKHGPEYTMNHYNVTPKSAQVPAE